MTVNVSVVPYDPQWPIIFESEEKSILNILDKNCLCIHHIGSTSVPGIAAKPTIDIIVAVRDRDTAISALQNIGYKLCGEWNIPFHYGLTRRDDRNVNLHLFLDQNHPEIELNLKFRDYLRSHPQVRDEYSQLKLKISEDKNCNSRPNGGLMLYTIQKAPFIEKVLRKIEYNRFRVLKANTESQWNAVKILCPNHEIVIDDHEHLIFYRGIDIVGYADIRMKPDPAKVIVFEMSDEKSRPFFDDFLKKRVQSV